MRKGQSLVEVMVALFVLTAGFLGILSLLAQSIKLSKTISNETVATYLAAEGIEVAHNLIYNDVYEHAAGFGFGWGSCFTPGGGDYEVDYTTTTCPPRAYSSQDLLEYEPATHTYLYAYNDIAGTAVPTAFTRLIRVTANGPSELIVKSIVMWNTGPFTSQNVDVEDHFYNWLP